MLHSVFMSVSCKAFNMIISKMRENVGTNENRMVRQLTKNHEQL